MKQAFAFNTSFTTKLNPQAIDSYQEFFNSIGVPSASKLGVVFDIVHAFPMINGNGHGFTSDVLKKSAMSFLNSLIDINHDRNCVAGSIVKVDLIEDDVSPLTIRLVGVLDKQILQDWGVEDLIDEDWSMECLYNDYAYCIGSKIYKPQDVPEIDKQFAEIAEGQAIYDKIGNRVGLLLGGIDGVVNFNRCGLIIWGEGADRLAETHLQVAHKKNKEGDVMPFKIFETEADYNAAIASVKQEVENNFNQTIVASKDQEIADWKAKAEDFETKYNAEKERADSAENKLQEQVTAALIAERKQALANVKYPEDSIEKKVEWLGKASKEEFDEFIEEVKALYASASKQLEAKASAMGLQGFASINLTGEQTTNKNNKNEEINPLL